MNSAKSAGTFYPWGKGAHTHYYPDGRTIVCSKKHGKVKPDYFKIWITIIAMVEAGLILFLINKNW